MPLHRMSRCQPTVEFVELGQSVGRSSGYQVDCRGQETRLELRCPSVSLGQRRRSSCRCETFKSGLVMQVGRVYWLRLGVDV